MAIVKRPVNAPPKTADDFINAAPDATPEAPAPAPMKGVQQGKQSQISLAMPPELLAKVDAAADRLSISRAGFIKMTLSQAVERAPIH